MKAIPLDIIQQRTRACLGHGGEPACVEFERRWVCRIAGDIRKALKQSEAGKCPKGLHLDATAEVRKPRPRQRPSQPAGLRRRLLLGAGSLLTWVLRLCVAPVNVVRWRRDHCRHCDKRKRFLLLFWVCSICKCLIRAKTAIASQGCPLPAPKWVPLKTDQCRSLPLKKCGDCGDA